MNLFSRSDVGSNLQKVEPAHWSEHLSKVFLDKYRQYLKAVFRQQRNTRDIHDRKPITVVEFHSLPHDLLTTGLAGEKSSRAVVQKRPAERDEICQRGRTPGEIQKALHELTPQSVPEVYDLLYEGKYEFILAQYLPYPPLSEMKLAPDAMVQVVAQLKQTLDIWHKHKWYHCDFGFPHVLVRKEGSFFSRRYHPYVIDYGEIRDCKGDKITAWNDFMELRRDLVSKRYTGYNAETANAIWTEAADRQ